MYSFLSQFALTVKNVKNYSENSDHHIECNKLFSILIIPIQQYTQTWETARYEWIDSIIFTSKSPQNTKSNFENEWLKTEEERNP